MGKLSWIVNLWAVVWTAFVSVIFFFPTEMPTAPDSMNYAVVYMGAIIICSVAYWFIHGRRFYTGPISEVTVEGQRVGNGGVGDGTGNDSSPSPAGSLHKEN